MPKHVIPHEVCLSSFSGCQSSNMRVNSSFSDSVSSPLLCFSNVSLYPRIFLCLDYTSSSIIFGAFSITNILFLPLYVFVLWTGFQRRNQRFSAAGSASDSDVFVYHIVIVEIICELGWVLACCATFTCSPGVLIAGYCLLLLSYPGETFFQCLTCVERYLAVVHPITYMGLKRAGGVKVRNISIGCVWLLCFGLAGVLAWYFPEIPSVAFYIIFIITIFVICFCSFSVLFVLIRLGQWKVGGNRQQTDKSKQRAFYTVTAIMVTLGIRLCGILLFNVMLGLEEGIGSNECVVIMSGTWFCLPSSLVLPLLFLHRAGTPARPSRN